MRTYRANGKLLLTGEYLVLKGALALALPTKMGQSLMVRLSQCGSPTIQWTAYKPDGPWFSAEFQKDAFEIISTDDQPKAEKLTQILKAVQELNPIAFAQGQHFETHLDFNPEWGLGSSSTLIANLAQWAEINPYSLLMATFGGSGYDIACAMLPHPLFYKLKDNKPLVAKANFDPPFADHLFFVYQGHKQQSSKEVAKFNSRSQDEKFQEDIETISKLTQALPTITKLDDFCNLMFLHETVLSRCLDKDPVQAQFPGFEGTLKSLGAWGGDFLLAATPWSYDKVVNYFKDKGLDTVFNYHDIIP